MREQTIHVVESYIDAVRRNDAAALPLHPDVIGEFPLNTYRGADAFREAVEPFAQILKSIDILRLIADGEHCVAILDIDTIYGHIPFAEHIHVVNREIVSVRAYYDPRPLLGSSNPTA